MSQTSQHDHVHAEPDDPYYLDQMCLVALSGGFGMVCLSLYFLQRDVLKGMLADQFFPFVLGSGIVLVILAGLRGVALWIQVGQEAPHDHAPSALASLPLLTETATAKEACDHHHGHTDCGHDHAAHGHSHGEGHQHGDQAGQTFQPDLQPKSQAEKPDLPDGHSHAHDHSHSHSHSHGHDHGDHTHNWAPWRYIVLLVPILLVVWGVPKGARAAKAHTPTVGAWETMYDCQRLFSEDDKSDSADGTKAHLAQGARLTTSWVALGPMPLLQLGVLTAAVPKRRSGPVTPLDFQTLEDSASKPEYRDYWAGKLVRVTGQYVPNPSGNDRVFSVGRYKINCCRPDAVQLNVPIICNDGITHIKRDGNQWIQVTAEIRYRKDEQGKYHTKLMVASKDDVIETEPDPNPYINAK